MNAEIKERIAAINSGIIPEGYKKTKVGIVPVEWETARFDKIATKFDYGLNAAAKEFDGENKYIRITDIDERSNKYSFSDVVSPDCELDEDYLVEENDILFARTGASTGKTYLYNQDDGKIFFAGFLIRANINIQNNAYFIFSQTLTERYANWVRIFSMRSGQPGINAQEYKSFEVLLPPLPEQQKIAEILSTQDKLIELQEKKIEQLKELKKAYLQKMFPKKGSKYPELRFKGFTEPWEQRKVIDLLELLTDYDANGSFADMAENVHTYDGEGFAWYVRTTDLENPKPLSELKYVDESSYKFLKKTELHGGELLMAKRGDIGKVYIFEPRTSYATVAPNMYLLKLNNLIFPHFLYYHFISNEGNKKLTRLNSSSTLGALYKDDVKNIKVKIPSIEEQTKIGNYFKEIDTLITLHQRKSEQEKQKKKALMQLLLKGIVRTK